MTADKSSYSDVRRAAERAGFIARKTRGARGGYMLVDRRTGACVAGSWHDLSAEQALAWIEEYWEGGR